MVIICVQIAFAGRNIGVEMIAKEANMYLVVIGVDGHDFAGPMAMISKLCPYNTMRLFAYGREPLGVLAPISVAFGAFLHVVSFKLYEFDQSSQNFDAVLVH